jgi:hypothetical protein
MRKNFSVEAFKIRINSRLADDRLSQETKRELSYTIDTLLMETGNYHGFNYIKWAKNGGFEQWLADGKPVDNKKYLGNEYDRFYY